jgi:hypothetical protein
MPRYRRLIAEGSVQHIISRFVNREPHLDIADARAEYLHRAGLVLARTDWRALGFALMSTHVHWAMRAGRMPSAAVIKPLHAGFAGWLNIRQHRVGPVFADRHRSLTFQGDTAAALLAYIHNNPVRAGVVTDPADSVWTSHRVYAGLAPAPPWLDVDLGLDLCGFSATALGRSRFHEMVVARSSETRRIDLSGDDMAARRRAERLARGVPAEIATLTVSSQDGLPRIEQVRARLSKRDLHSPWRGDGPTVLKLVAQATGTSFAALRSRTRARNVTRARRIALLLWTIELRRPAVEMADVIGISSSTASEARSQASSEEAALANILAGVLSGERHETEIPRTVP